MSSICFTVTVLSHMGTEHVGMEMFSRPDICIGCFENSCRYRVMETCCSMWLVVQPLLKFKYHIYETLTKNYWASRQLNLTSGLSVHKQFNFLVSSTLTNFDFHFTFLLFTGISIWFFTNSCRCGFMELFCLMWLDIQPLLKF